MGLMNVDVVIVPSCCRSMVRSKKLMDLPSCSTSHCRSPNCISPDRYVLSVAVVMCGGSAAVSMMMPALLMSQPYSNRLSCSVGMIIVSSWYA